MFDALIFRLKHPSYAPLLEVVFEPAKRHHSPHFQMNPQGGDE